MALEGMQLGQYRLLRLIGKGGMGEVYLAEDTRIARQVAIKVVQTEASGYPDAKAVQEATRLFQREMKVITALDHPRILQIFDYGEENINKTTLTYMVMPFRKEGSLADWLQARSSTELLSPQDIAYLLEQAADALQYAHDLQIVHQDIKPSNFLIHTRKEKPNRPDLLLADFGIAKITNATATASQTVRGTPAYMAPEQWDGNPVPATDQYALAVMAYHLLTGLLPFQGGPGQIMRQHFNMEPLAPSKLNPQLSAAVDAVILRSLAKQPENRFPSISAFAQAFQQASQTHSTLSATLTVSQEEAAQGSSRTLTLPEGRQVSVRVPQGAYDGQVIRLEGLGEPYYDDGPRDALILTIAIKHTVLPTPPSSFGAEQGIMTSDNEEETPIPPPPPPPFIFSQGEASISSDSKYEPATPRTILATPYGSGAQLNTSPPQPQRNKSRLVLIGLSALALLVILSSAVIYTVNKTATDHANATATAINTSKIKATAVAQSTVNASSTFFAHVNENATATTTAFQNFYVQATSGIVSFSDQLSQASQWYDYTDNTFGGACHFTNGAYHAIISKPNRSFYCEPSSSPAPDFSNFALEVQMRILKGDCGGVVFRNDSTNGKNYTLDVCQDGTYTLYVYTDNTHSNTLISGSLITTKPGAFKTGLNQLNLITVIANHNMLYFYTNKTYIDSVSDNTYGHGFIGLIANDNTNPTDVAYNNVKVWKL